MKRVPLPPEVKLIRAACNGRTDVIREILADGAQIDFQDDEKKMNLPSRRNLRPRDWRDTPPAVAGKSGMTALMWACHLHRTRAAEILLEAGADPNIRNFIGETVLFSIDADPSLIDKVLAKGAKVNAQNIWGATPLMMALDNKNFILAEKLLDHSADPTLKTTDGADAFDIARHGDTPPYLMEKMHQAVADKKERMQEFCEAAARGIKQPIKAAKKIVFKMNK